MLRLRRSILAQLLSSSSIAIPTNSSLHRLFSATAARNPSFAVGDYLVDTCGLTGAQALKASAKLSHLKSPSNPDTVLAFLAGLGFSRADVVAAVAKDPQLLCAGVDKTLSPNVAGLTGLGLSRPDIARLFSLANDRFRSRSIVPKLRYLLPLFGSSENLFRALKNNRCTLQAVAFFSEEKIAAKVESLKNTFRWSDAEVAIVVCKAPMILRRSNESLQLKSDCLISELGLEPAYIAHNPTFILCSLEGRVRPRYYVVKFLKENRLLDRQWSYCSVVTVGEKRFVEEFIRPHKEAALHLAEDYAAACRGEVPARLMLASTKTLP